MPIIDLSNWRFSLGGSLPQFAGTAHFEPPLILALETPADLLRHLADADEGEDTAYQNQIQARLSNDPEARAWHRRRTPFGTTLHFNRYRDTAHYETYHDAAIALAQGTASSLQRDMVSGLNAEIRASNVVVPAGQVVFHGRGDLRLHSDTPYPTFISTSLDPTVCLWHARKRANHRRSTARAVIYSLTLRDDLPAMWGQGGNRDEWELLLQSDLTCAQTARHAGKRFDVIEATIGV